MAEPKDAKTKDQAILRELKRRLSNRRWIIERAWWGNLLFYLGQQWIIYDQHSRRWKQRRLSPSVPTPVTNYFRSTIDTVKSAIAQHDPRYIGVPSRDDARAVAAAASTDQQLQVILKEGRFDLCRARMLDWLLLTGNAFQEVSWDNSDDTGLDAVPLEVCEQGHTFKADDLDPNTPICPKDGTQLMESATEYEWMPRGEIRFDSISPFEMYLDPVIETFEHQPFIMTIQSYTQEQIKQRWDKEVEGGAVGSIESQSMVHKESISAIAPGFTPGTPYGSSAGGDFTMHRVIVFRAYIKEHKEYPDGVYLCMTDRGKLLEKKTPYPWRTRAGAGRKFFPITHYRFGTVSGRAWGFSPADDLLPKQYQLNKAESLMTLIMSRMANPVWLIPANTNPSRISGEIGVQIEYTPVGGAVPTRVPGAEAPQSLVKYITDIRQSFDELSGAFAAVRGRSMGSRTPVGTVQSLQERGFGRWATVFNELELGYQDIAKKSLEIWRDNAYSPRVLALRDAIGGFTFKEFQGADWDDGVDVMVEAGSSRPQTQSEKMQMYMQLGQVGALDFADEAQKIKMLEDLGMLNMRPGVEEDTKHAYKENAEFMQWARQSKEQLANIPDPNMQQMAAMQLAVSIPVHVLPLVDDHAVHFLTHRRLALTEEFQSLPAPLQSAWFMHMMQHKADVVASKILKMPMGPVEPGSPVSSGSGAGSPGAPPGGGSPHQAPTKQMQGGQSNPSPSGHNTGAK
jgi:hypothetical protein